MSWIRVIALVGVAVAVLGCGGSKGTKVTPPTVTPKEGVKKALESIVNTGQGGSIIGEVHNQLKKLKETDPALAEELGKDASALMSTQLSADEVKAKAQAMLKKLEGATGG